MIASDVANVEQIMEDSRNAGTRLKALRPMQSMDLEALSTGWGRQLRTSVASAAESVFGPAVADYIDDDADMSQTFQGLSQALINEDLRLNNGVQTEGDAQRARLVFPSINKLPGANKFLLSYMVGIEERKQSRARFYRERIGQGYSAASIEDEWRQYVDAVPLVAPSFGPDNLTIKYPGTNIPMVYPEFEKLFMQSQKEQLSGMSMGQKRTVAEAAWVSQIKQLQERAYGR